MHNFILKKNGKYLSDYRIKRDKINGFDHLNVKWTKLSTRAKVLDRNNDWINELSTFPGFNKGCRLIPKWTSFDKFYSFYSNFAEKSFKLLEKEKLEKSDIIYLKKNWKEIVRRMTVDCYGWNETSANDVFDWGSDGHNWELLWHPYKEEEKDSRYKHNPYLDEFRNKNSKELLKNFLWELNYCSDRMSIDRLFRCHWQFNLVIKTWLDENKLYFDHKDCLKVKTW